MLFSHSVSHHLQHILAKIGSGSHLLDSVGRDEVAFGLHWWLPQLSPGELLRGEVTLRPGPWWSPSFLASPSAGPEIYLEGSCWDVFWLGPAIPRAISSPVASPAAQPCLAGCSSGMVPVVYYWLLVSMTMTNTVPDIMERPRTVTASASTLQVFPLSV